MLNLHAMQAFRRVVELQSFSEAARSLGMTGGAVSKLVAQLEEVLNARLLTRTTRKVSVTDVGMTFYEATVRVFGEIEMATEAVHAQAAAPKGTLKVSVPTSFALMWLSQRIPDFLARHPELRLDLALNDRFVDLIEEGYDCAIRIATRLPDSTLTVRRLGTVDRLLVASPQYLKRAPALRTPDDLKAHNCLTYSLSSTPDEWPLSGMDPEKPMEVSGNFRVNNSVMLREVLLAGCGITLTPRFVVDDLLEKETLVEVLPQHRPEPHTTFGVIAHRRYVPQKVRVFLNFVQEALRY